MIVRFVTKRFIGDYDPNLETIYRHTTLVDDQLVNFEVMDTAGQDEKSLLLEDKCKWGESFVFVYDVTDKYSFDELTRLKFIASYTHSRLRVNFTPCWVLIGNKTDLSNRERMVTIEEGKELAKELGCHFFREISVKESMNESGEVFEDLWREFSRLSPRSPSSSQRRKFSTRIQDKISVLDSSSCSCAATDVQRHQSSVSNGSVKSSISNNLKRQASAPTLLTSNLRTSKDFYHSDANNHHQRIDCPRNCPCIPENNEELDECDTRQRRSFIRRRIRRSDTVHNIGESKPLSFPLFQRRKALSISVENVFTPSNPTSPKANFLTSSSRSSSNSSLNGSSSPSWSSASFKLKQLARLRGNDTSQQQQNGSSDRDPMLVLYQDHCRRNRGRRSDQSACSRLASSTNFASQPCEVDEVGS